jgi:hypothetical protein
MARNPRSTLLRVRIASAGAAAALQFSLLQSWGGVLRVFPAVPDAWGSVSFASMRGESQGLSFSR